MDRPHAAPTLRAQAVVFDDGRLLCARHAKGGEVYWVLPGGHVEAGESVWEALVRELDEEAGLAVTAGRLWAVGEFVATDRRVLDVAFRVTGWDGEAALGADPDAGSRPASLVDLAWLDRDAVARGPFRPGVLARRLLEAWDEPDAPAAYVGVELG